MGIADIPTQDRVPVQVQEEVGQVQAPARRTLVLPVSTTVGIADIPTQDRVPVQVQAGQIQVQTPTRAVVGDDA